MKVKIATLVIGSFLFAGIAAPANADDSNKTTHKKTRTLFGCLSQGDGVHEYNLRAKDGATWEIRSGTVKLHEHLGHTVRITGVVQNATAHGMKEDVKGEMKEHGMDKHTAEHGHMEVTAMKMVSSSCKD